MADPELVLLLLAPAQRGRVAIELKLQIVLMTGQNLAHEEGSLGAVAEAYENAGEVLAGDGDGGAFRVDLRRECSGRCAGGVARRDDGSQVGEDRVDAQAAPYYVGGELLLHTTAIRQKIQDCSGSYFAPQLVSAFLRASSTEAFWLQLEPRGIQGALQDMLSQGMPCDASLAQIKQLATIFSQIVDAKSAFTGQHSFGVARLARLIAERMGVDATQCDKLEIAALLHDLGKLRVPDEVLEKPGTLDERERKIINAHSFETFQILHQIKGFEEIAHWAAYHHEEPNGNGYPFHIYGDTLPLEARILRVADIFQALAQDRPYRAGLPPEAIAEILRQLVADGRAERAIIDAALSDMNESMRAACP